MFVCTVSPTYIERSGSLFLPLQFSHPFFLKNIFFQVKLPNSLLHENEEHWGVTV